MNNKKIFIMCGLIVCMIISSILLMISIHNVKKNKDKNSAVKETTLSATKNTTKEDGNTDNKDSKDSKDSNTKNVTNNDEKTSEKDNNSSSDVNADNEEPTKEEKKLNVSYDVTNEWESGDTYFKQYDFTIENVTSETFENWEISIEVPAGTEIGSCWNCNAKVENGKLYIDGKNFYTSSIAAGAKIEGIGVIISSKTKAPLSNDIIENVSSSEESKNTQSDNSTKESTSSASNESETEKQTAKSNEVSTSTNVVPKEVVFDEPGQAVANHGALSVSGTTLVDKNGNPYRLCGVSTHGISWFPDYVNKEAFRTLRDDWGVNVIRLAIYPKEYNGYLSGGNQTELKNLIDKGVQYATELGMYVIIDWHVLNFNPNDIKSEAMTFFDEMSAKYCNYNNVIYEICNEPVGAPWSSIRSYANDVVSVIRKHDSNAIILVGTNTWSQDVDEVVGNRLDNDSNVMYVSHFYAASHRDEIRRKIRVALNAGVPVFVSECSICDASGNGGIDYTSANEWFDFFAENNMSYICWSLCNKAETSALISSGCSKTSGFTVNDLSETGKWFRERIRKDMGM